jgi:PIN domain
MSEQATVPSKASPEPRLAYVIYDTNTAMHCKRADQIDWPALTKCDEVILVATPIFLKELDKHKNTHPSRRLRNRAKDYMSWLLSFSRDPALEIRPKVRWHFLLHEPIFDFAAHALSKDSPDDQLIATTIVFAPSVTGPLFLATADGYVEMKARAHHIEPLVIPEADRLPSEPDPLEKENLTLRREIMRLTNRVPSLSLVFAENGEQHLKIKLTLTATVADAKSVDEIRREHPLLPIPAPPWTGIGTAADSRRLRGLGVTPPVSAWSRDEVQHYNRFLEHFYQEWTEHLEALREWQKAGQRRFQVRLVLANGGTATATNLDLSITFPPEVIVCADEGLPARPGPPEPPPLVPGPIVRLVEDHFDVHSLIPHYTRSTVVDTEDGTVTFHAAELKHGHEELLLPFWVRFPTRESVPSFSAQYKVTVSEPIDAAGGELHFVVQAVENRGGQE